MCNQFQLITCRIINTDGMRQETQLRKSCVTGTVFIVVVLVLGRNIPTDQPKITAEMVNSLMIIIYLLTGNQQTEDLVLCFSKLSSESLNFGETFSGVVCPDATPSLECVSAAQPFRIRSAQIRLMLTALFFLLPPHPHLCPSIFISLLPPHPPPPPLQCIEVIAPTEPQAVVAHSTR